MKRKKGMLIVYSGPSGVGKGTIMRKLLPLKNLKLCFSVSMTTRKPRPGEEDGRDYFFVSKKRFEKAIKSKELLEYATFVDNYYGTPYEFVKQKCEEGYNVILEIETKGAKQVIKRYGDDNILSIYIAPPSIDDLKSRLLNRGTEPEAIIKKRIATAKKELKQLDLFDYVVINDDRERCYKEVRDIIKKEMKKDKHIKNNK